MPRLPTAKRTTSEDTAYLRRLGSKIREARAQRGMTRTALAADSGVSLRFLAQLEAGEGNPSLLVLRRIATSMSFSPDTFLAEQSVEGSERAAILRTLSRLSDGELIAARELLTTQFVTGASAAPAVRYVALVGLRGAGKTTLGRQLANHRGVPFFELDREVEREYGASIGEILQLHGQPGYRRFEREGLRAILASNEAAVIETGGGLAADPETLPALLASAFTIWLRASPAEHMQRVVAQGDLRPMARSRLAMQELTEILRAREPFYRQSHRQLDTSGKTVQQSFSELLDLLAMESAAPATVGC